MRRIPHELVLGAAGDRRGQLDKLGRQDHHDRVRRGQNISGGDRAMFWISRHYLAIFNIFLLFYFGLAMLAPVMMQIGATGPGNVIYTIYKPLCHQFGFRSFFLFWEQAYYPLKEAGIPNVLTFDEVTGFEDLGNPAAYSLLGFPQDSDENLSKPVLDEIRPSQSHQVFRNDLKLSSEDLPIQMAARLGVEVQEETLELRFEGVPYAAPVVVAPAAPAATEKK